jgi:thiol-disulfide isomerase/thioredoxin
MRAPLSSLGAPCLAAPILAVTILSVAVFMLVGCGSTSSEKPPAPKTLAIAEIDGPGLENEIARHRGKVVFVDFWATWCEPCVEFFPHTVQLHKQFAPKGFTAISVSMDSLESREEVNRFLAEHDAKFPCFVSNLGMSQKSAEQFGISSGVPCLRLYGRDGKLIREWDTLPAEYEEAAGEMQAEVEKALAADVPPS